MEPRLLRLMADIMERPAIDRRGWLDLIERLASLSADQAREIVADGLAIHRSRDTRTGEKARAINL